MFGQSALPLIQGRVKLGDDLSFPALLNDTGKKLRAVDRILQNGKLPEHLYIFMILTIVRKVISMIRVNLIHATNVDETAGFPGGCFHACTGSGGSQ